MAEIKAIETVYNGYRFRSRLEARWAVFFDAAGIKYEYEKEGFELGDAGRYLPDFWLPEWHMWAEVKGEEFTDDEMDKCWALSRMTYSAVAFLVGPPAINNYVVYGPQCMSDDPAEWAAIFYHECLRKGITMDIGASGLLYPSPWEKLCPSIRYCIQQFKPYFKIWKLQGHIPELPLDVVSFPVTQMDEPAVIKARQARFEFGETPKAVTVR